jgi:hypothetical protein
MPDKSGRSKVSQLKAAGMGKLYARKACSA